ncbi:MAG: nitroreductase family protein [Candidatus Wallbacteria bacterium]
MEQKQVIFNHAKCVKCGLCKRICPMEIIEIKDKNTPPEVSKENLESCIQCGHCESVCPNNAVRVEGPLLVEVPRLTPEMPLVFSSLSYHMKMRRSIRHYLDKPVEKEKLNKLFDTVRYAPTGVNRQQINWLILYDTEEVKKLASIVIDWMKDCVNQKFPFAEEMGFEYNITAHESNIDVICRSAPHVAITYGPAGIPICQTDAAIALSYLELAAPTLGLGCCWGGFISFAAAYWPPLTEFLKLPKGQAYLGSMMIGYPKYKFQQIPKRNKINLEYR